VPTRAEAGCVGIHLYESLRGREGFVIHSQWVDEGAFDAHAELPHMRRFLGLVGKLVTHAVRAVRCREIG
jgi:quinol monooxygenase YgiN